MKGGRRAPAFAFNNPPQRHDTSDITDSLVSSSLSKKSHWDFFDRLEYNIKGNKILSTCFASDFFLPEADEWRVEAWSFIRERTDIDFLILTKRIDRFLVSLPDDWGEGYDNVNLGCTVENQEMADYRLPLFLSYPIKRRFIACAPLLEAIDLTPYLHGVQHVTVGGESGRAARECDYRWVINIREQ